MEMEFEIKEERQMVGIYIGIDIKNVTPVVPVVMQIGEKKHNVLVIGHTGKR